VYGRFTNRPYDLRGCSDLSVGVSGFCARVEPSPCRFCNTDANAPRRSTPQKRRVVPAAPSQGRSRFATVRHRRAEERACISRATFLLRSHNTLLRPCHVGYAASLFGCDALQVWLCRVASQLI